MKTMKKYLFMAVAAIAALSSCSSDNDFEQSQTGKQALVFTATLENSEATRATFDSENKCAAWEAGDQISINGKTYSAQTAGTTTTFEADAEGATGTTYNAYFPADLYDGTTATLPAIQTYEAGEFNMPMYASSTTTELQFYNLCAVLAIKITSADIATLKSIKVASDKVMNGSFTVTDNKAVMGTDGTKTVVLESSTAITLDETGTTFYIAIPAQEYQYLNIFLSADGKTYTQAMATKKAAGLGDIARSKIFNIDYVKNATKLLAGNLFFADYNIGATSATSYTSGYYCWGRSINQENPGTCNSGESVLTGDDDTATKLWGSNWRMPTEGDLVTLLNSCTPQWTTNYNGSGVNGLLFTGKDACASNILFFPATAACNDGSVLNGDCGSYGNYWTSTPVAGNTANARYMHFRSNWHGISPYDRTRGFAVRAVLEEADTPAPPTKGKAYATGPDCNVNWVQLWAGGPKFAEYNVGATSATSYTSDYYCWGRSINQENPGTCNSGESVLTGDDDTATKLWGSNWRMPTLGDFQALLNSNNCTAQWTINYNESGINGLLCTGKDAYADNSVFFPAVASCNDGSVISDKWGTFGNYWTSTPVAGNTAKAMYMYICTSYNSISPYDRTRGFAIRPVLAE